jgi:hypothetical protein
LVGLPVEWILENVRIAKHKWARRLPDGRTGGTVLAIAREQVDQLIAERSERWASPPPPPSHTTQGPVERFATETLVAQPREHAWDGGNRAPETTTSAEVRIVLRPGGEPVATEK